MKRGIQCGVACALALQLLLCGCQNVRPESPASSTETALTNGPAATTTASAAQPATEPIVRESLVVQPEPVLTEAEGVRFYMDTDIIRDLDEPFDVTILNERSDFVVCGQLYTIDHWDEALEQWVQLRFAPSNEEPGLIGIFVPPGGTEPFEIELSRLAQTPEPGRYRVVKQISIEDDMYVPSADSEDYVLYCEFEIQ